MAETWEDLERYVGQRLETKRFYCELCDLACGSGRDLKKHFDTLKHLAQSEKKK